MSEKKEKKNILIGGLLVAIIAMAVGYAALAQQLTINGTAQVSSTWDVQITSISDGTATNSAGVASTATEATAPSYTATSATFDVQFKTPGDTMEYDVVVSNLGSLEAKLNNVTLTAKDASNGASTVTEANGINYEVTVGGKAATEAINTTIAGKAGETVSTQTFHVKVWWDKAATTIPTTTTKKLTVNLEYVQA